MKGDEIRERARRVRDAFHSEAKRIAANTPMSRLFACYVSVANLVSDGEYHRASIFRAMVERLGDMGFDVSGVDTSPCERSDGACDSARNAKRDTYALYQAAAHGRGGHPAEFRVVSRADDLMADIADRAADIRVGALELHEAVTDYLDWRAEGAPGFSIDGGTFVGSIHGFSISLPGDREVPERVIFNPPATIAFWPDGSKTVAKCAPGEEFSEYTGLLVAIAKRHLRVPRRATFEDVMAKLLKRAERQRPRAERWRQRAKGGEES